MKITKSNTKKDEHNTKQIKYRRKLHLTLLSLSFFRPMVSCLIIYLKKHKTQWNLREGTANTSRDVYWAKVNQQLTLPRRYSQLAAVASFLVRNPRHRSSSEAFVARKICSWTGAFVNRGSTVVGLCWHVITSRNTANVSRMYFSMYNDRRMDRRTDGRTRTDR
jgi:hypothetical protein